MEAQAVLRKFLSYFLNGLLLILPLALTIYVIVSIVVWLDAKMVTLGLPAKGMGILIVVIGVALVGFLGTSFLFKPLKKEFDKLINRIPLVKTIYTSISDLLSAFVGEKKRFSQPVLVKLSKSSDVEKIGFITDEDLSDFEVSSGKIAVYLPHSYAFSGNLYIVPRENVTPIDKSAADVMKYIVSGGVTEIEQEKGGSN